MKKFEKLIEEVETLCALYVGRNAEGEQWGQTIARLEALKKTVRAAKKEVEQAKAGKTKPAP